MKKPQILTILTAVVLLTMPLVTAAQDAIIEPTALDFGKVEIGDSVTRSVTITNSVDVDDALEIYDISFYNCDVVANPFEITSISISSNPIILPVGESVTVELTYTPSSLGPHTCVMVITSNDSIPPITAVAMVDLIGTGVESREVVREMMDELLDRFEDAVQADLIEGTGKSQQARQNRIETIYLKLQLARRFIELGLYADACNMLSFVIERSDGDDRPFDFITGDAASELNGFAVAVSNALDCNSGGE
jgi:hypothetical protein